MSEAPSARQETPVRLFKSDFLEFFSHMSPIAVLVIFLPMVAYFLWRAFTLNMGRSILLIVAAFLVGLIIWTPSEYLLHRFVFHFSPPNPSEKMKRFLFLMHGVHHAQPRVKTRLVMPPALSIPLSALFYLLFWLVIGRLLNLPALAPAVFAGFMLGYVIYDTTHYALHHFSFSGGYWQKLRRHHMAHHFKTHNMRFGVSSWIWDDVFHTNVKD
jgi:sterol desaturase/sphingolipid hydroxylase (fatty acid hydroxylase superfamily)